MEKHHSVREKHNLKHNGLGVKINAAILACSIIAAKIWSVVYGNCT